MDVKTNQFVQVYGWNAIVLDVFKSDSGRVALELAFAKDVARSNPPEVHVLKDVQEGTQGAFVDEVKAIHDGQNERLRELVTFDAQL